LRYNWTISPRLTGAHSEWGFIGRFRGPTVAYSAQALQSPDF